MPQTMNPKDPSDDLDYTMNWATRLGTDTISTSVWSVLPTGPTLHADTHSSTAATVWVSGGTAGVNYKITNRITTVGGRDEQDSIYLPVRDN